MWSSAQQDGSGSCDYVELSTAGWLIVMWLQLSHVTMAQHSRMEEITVVV